MWKYVLALLTAAFSAALLAAPLGSDIGRDPVTVEEKLERARDANNAVFTALDSNGDDRIDKGEAEIERRLRIDFDEVDTNSDGVISNEEYLAHRNDDAPGQ